MASSFDGVSFEVLSEPLGRAREALAAIRPIPGGATVYVDRAGKQPRVLNLRLYVEDANLDTLESKVGETGTLIHPEGTVSAFFRRLERETREWDPADGAFVHIMVAEFVVL